MAPDLPPVVESPGAILSSNTMGVTMSILSRTLALATSAVIAAATLTGPATAQDATGQQLYPLFTYRTGPYAPSFIPFGAGNIDYLRYVNEVEGGVNGVKILIQECETAYTIERGIECYERYKGGFNGALTAAIYPHSSGLDVALTDKARNKKLGVDAMQGACFTISSLGHIGGTGFTPIVNAPEVAILGVSKATMQPVWDGSAFQPRLKLPLSLSYDHRVINGAAAARFTKRLSELLADIRTLLL